MATINAIGSTIPIPITKGGTNATSMGTSTGIVKYDGTSLVTSTTAKLDASNIYTNTSQPSFLAYLAATLNNKTGAGGTVLVNFTSSAYDNGSNYNTGTSLFTAPVAGKYYFYSQLTLSNVLTANVLWLRLVTSGKTYFSQQMVPKPSSNLFSVQISGIASMTAGQTAQIQVTCGGQATTVGYLGSASPNLVTYFTGYLMC